MEDRQQRTISALNRLVETCEDSARGFRQVADRLEEAEHRSLFGQYSHQRAEYAAQLSEEVRRLGGKPPEGGSTGGALRRGWTNLKSTLTDNDPETILGAVETEEQRTLEEYREVLEESLPEYVREIVETQYAAVREAHSHLSTLQIKST